MRQFQCVPTTYVTENKEENYLEIYIFQVSCPLSLPLLNIPNCQSVFIRTACDIQIEGRRGAGRPKLTWKKLTERDCCEWKLTTVDLQERSTCRSGVRSAMRAASQLPGKGPTDVDDAP